MDIIEKLNNINIQLFIILDYINVIWSQRLKMFVNFTSGGGCRDHPVPHGDACSQ